MYLYVGQKQQQDWVEEHLDAGGRVLAQGSAGPEDEVLGFGEIAIVQVEADEVGVVVVDEKDHEEAPVVASAYRVAGEAASGLLHIRK